MPVYVTPGVYYETVDLDSSQITSLRTDIAAFIGIAERGPVQTPVPVTTFQQFQSLFGNFIPQGYLAYSVKAFFENGGDRCHIVRVAAAVVSTATDPAVIQPADGHSSIVLSVDGFVAGAVVTVRRDATRRHDHILEAINPGTRELIWQVPLEADLLGAPLTFDSGASPAGGVFFDATGKPTLQVQASSPGKWGNAVTVETSHSSGAATVLRNAIQPNDRLSSLVSSLTGFVPGALVKAFQDQGGGVTLVEYHIVQALNPSRGQVFWDTALAAGFDISNPATHPIYFETLEFNLSVALQGKISEVFTGLSLVKTHPQYVETVVNAQSKQIQVQDLQSPSPIPQNLPDPAAPNLVNGALVLVAGRDGIAALQMLDFTGMPGLRPKVGIAALEDVDEISIVAVPDILIQPAPLPQYIPPIPPVIDPCALCPAPPLPAPPPPPPLNEIAPTFSLDEIFYVQQAMVNHCEAMKYRIAVLDPPLFSQGKESKEIAEIQTWRNRFDSRNAALYFPWAIVYDPLQLGGNVVRSIPPSGHVVGTYANTDLTVGVHRAPANYELNWVQDFLVDIDATVQGILNPLGINCLRTFPGRGLRVYGARTVSSDPSWIYVNVKRLMMMIEKSLEFSLQWAVFEPNDARLRLAVSGAITVFLEAVYEAGALTGATDNQAFYVKCDATNNPSDVTDAGQFVAEVGVAPAIPAEFIVFRVGRTQDRLEITE
jgi:phage tail sheath protein FI